MSVQKAPSAMWVAENSVMVTMRDLIAKYHPDLAICDDEIAIVFKEKASTVGDAVVAGKSAKAPKILGVLGETEYKFVITLGADVWQTLGDDQRIALLDHHLCACRAEENPQNATVRFYIQPPDVAFYQDEIVRHGFWRTSGVAASSNLIAELFGSTPGTP